MLTAADISGLVTTVTDTIEVDTTAKPTQYLTSATDLTVQLGGATRLPRAPVRFADGRSVGHVRLRLAAGQHRHRHPDDRAADRPRSTGHLQPVPIGTRLYLTLPDGTRAGFTFAPVEHQQLGVVYYTPAWQADPGVTYTLSSAPAVLGAAVDRLYDLRTAQPYNPASGDFGPCSTR